MCRSDIFLIDIQKLLVVWFRIIYTNKNGIEKCSKILTYLHSHPRTLNIQNNFHVQHTTLNTFQQFLLGHSKL